MNAKNNNNQNRKHISTYGSQASTNKKKTRKRKKRVASFVAALFIQRGLTIRVTISVMRIGE